MFVRKSQKIQSRASEIRRKPGNASLLVLFLVALSICSFAANSAELPGIFAVGKPELEKGNPMPAILELNSREAEYAASSKKNSYFQHLGTLYSRVGEYRRALELFDQAGQTHTLLPKDLQGLNAEPALTAIAATAKSQQAVFINEAHHVPQHRMFSALLLRELRQLGFEYFAAETLNAFDKELVARGYPLIRKTGYYTDEPICGDLVRTALKLGFKIVPYEAPYQTCEDPADNPNYCQNLREKTQAENLYSSIFKEKPKAKIVVHAGYGHIDEKGGDGWIPMGSYFKTITGINPLTIDQVSLMEHSDPKYEYPVYRAILSKFSVSSASILRTLSGGFWTEPWRKGAYDIQIIHPRANYQQGRPDWLLMGSIRKFQPIPKDSCKAVYPCLIQVFYKGESESAVPIDQIMIREEGNQNLALPSGDFRVRALRTDGEVLSLKDLHVQ